MLHLCRNDNVFSSVGSPLSQSQGIFDETSFIFNNGAHGCADCGQRRGGRHSRALSKFRRRGRRHHLRRIGNQPQLQDRKSVGEGKRVSVRVELGGGGNI